MPNMTQQIILKNLFIAKNRFVKLDQILEK